MIKINRRYLIQSSIVLFGGILSVVFVNCAKSGFEAVGSDLQPVEPFLAMAWHIQNTGQKVFASTAGTPGVDLNLQQSWNSGLNGTGIRILVSDDGVEDVHEDLHANYLYGGLSKNYSKNSPYLSENGPPIQNDDNHGTCVSGLIAAAANGKGSMGVAPKASLVSANFLSSGVAFSEGTILDQASGPFDIFNMSWGQTQNTLPAVPTILTAKFKSGTETGRNGKGSIFIKSAGNDFFVHCHNSETDYCVGNSNFDDDDSSPYTIIVSALNGKNNPASYSSFGSNVWIASFGGEYGGEQVNDLPAMITSDRAGCTLGYSQTNAATKIDFNKGGNGNSDCNYVVNFNGTSAAAPVLSGAVALILQANPNLTWRDVKYILAKTAVPPNYVTVGSIGHPLNAVLPTGLIWEQVWVVNAAGFKFHNWFGFGRVDVDAAVQLARNFTSPLGAFQETNWSNDKSGLSLAIPDNSAAGVTSTIDVASDIKLEAVQIKVWVTHPDISTLAIELTSPSGTKSIMVNMHNSLKGIANYSGDVFLSNAFYRESSKGTWTIKLIDGKATQTGTLTRWSLNMFGSN